MLEHADWMMFNICYATASPKTPSFLIWLLMVPMNCFCNSFLIPFTKLVLFPKPVLFLGNLFYISNFASYPLNTLGNFLFTFLLLFWDSKSLFPDYTFSCLAVSWFCKFTMLKTEPLFCVPLPVAFSKRILSVLTSFSSYFLYFLATSPPS